MDAIFNSLSDKFSEVDISGGNPETDLEQGSPQQHLAEPDVVTPRLDLSKIQLNFNKIVDMPEFRKIKPGKVEDRLNFIMEKMYIDPDQILVVEELTRDKTKKQDVLNKVGYPRITASSFHKYLPSKVDETEVNDDNAGANHSKTGANNGKHANSQLEKERLKIFGPDGARDGRLVFIDKDDQFDDAKLTEIYKETDSTKYGINHEEDARKLYELVSDVQVKPCGMFLHSTGLLGAEPDGLIGDDTIIEIKCLHKNMDKSIAEAVEHHRAFCKKNKEEDKDGKNDISDEFVPVYEEDPPKIYLNDTYKYAYYHQIQGELYLAGKEYCELVAWNPHGIGVATIKKDINWEKNLTTLLKAFRDKVLRELLKNHDKMR